MKSIIRLMLISTCLLAGVVFISFSTKVENHTKLISNCSSTSQSCSQAQAGADVLNTNGNVSTTHIIGLVVDTLAWIIGLASIFMIIFGGFRYVTSAGEPNATSSARNTVLYALIGVAVAAIAQVLVYFVLNKIVTPVPETPKHCIQWDNYTAGKCLKYGP